MALQVWLPLNGNLKNNGLQSDAPVNAYNTTIVDNGLIGQTYEFSDANSSGTYIEVENVSIPTDCWSASCWFYPTIASDDTNRYILCMNTSSSTDFMFSLSHYKNHPVLRIRSTNYSASETVTLNTWHHIAGTFDGNTAKLYYDGALVLTVSDPAVPVASTTVFIGRRGGNAGGIKGNINDARIYDHVLTPKEIKELSMALVVHYPLDGICQSDGRISDSSGYEYHATAVNISNSTDTPRYSASTSFDGTAYILGPSPTSEIKSASAWVYLPAGAPATDNLIFSEYRSHIAFGLYHHNNSGNDYLVCSAEPVGVYDYPSTYPLSALSRDVWHHVVLIRDDNNSKIRLWIDAVEISGDSITSWRSGMSDGISIGARTNTTSSRFTGKVSDLRFYSTILSADDIQYLYNSKISADRNAALYAQEFIEDETVSATRDCRFYADEFNELGKVKEVTGTEFTLLDAAEETSVKSMVVNIEPIQNGSGDPSPTNVRPFVSLNGLTVSRFGKNLCPQLSVPSWTDNGITFTRNDDGSLTANGTAAPSSATAHLRIFAGTIPSGEYAFCGCASGGSNVKYDLYCWDTPADARAKKWDRTTDSASSFDQETMYQVYIDSTHDYSLNCRIFSGNTVDNIVYRPMLIHYYGSDTDRSFEAYKGEKYFIGNVVNGHTWIRGKYYADNGSLANSTNIKYIEDYIPVTPLATYIYRINDTSSNHLRIHTYDENKNWLAQAVNTADKSGTVKFASNVRYIRVSTPVYSSDIVIVNQTIGNFGAGTLNVLTGELMITWQFVDLGTCSITAASPAIPNGFGARVNVSGRKYGYASSGIVGYCSHYKFWGNGVTSTLSSSLSNNEFGYQATNNLTWIRDDTCSTIEELKAKLSGVILLYELETPVTYYLSPNEVRTLSSETNIWTNCGQEIKMEYFTNETIDKVSATRSGTVYESSIHEC